jgi:hypothetical protein
MVARAAGPPYAYSRVSSSLRDWSHSGAVGTAHYGAWCLGGSGGTRLWGARPAGRSGLVGCQFPNNTESRPKDLGLPVRDAEIGE